MKKEILSIIIIMFLLVLTSCSLFAQKEKEEIRKIKHSTPCATYTNTSNEKVIHCMIGLNSSGGKMIQEVYLLEKYYFDNKKVLHWNETI